MKYVYDEKIKNISENKKKLVENIIVEQLSVHFDLSCEYLETVSFVLPDYFEDNVAALAKPKNKTIFLNFYSLLNVVENNYSAESEEYKSVINTLFHEYIHLQNHYEDLVVYNQYIDNMDAPNYIKCSISTLMDEYVATYKSGKILFADNEIHKKLPLMCDVISKYKGKRKSRLYWDVISNLGIGIAQDTLILEKEGTSQYCKDVNAKEMVEYKELILRIRHSLIEFFVTEKYECLDELKLCAEEMCEIFGMDKQFLEEIDNFTNLRENVRW